MGFIDAAKSARAVMASSAEFHQLRPLQRVVRRPRSTVELHDSRAGKRLIQRRDNTERVLSGEFYTDKKCRFANVWPALVAFSKSLRVARTKKREISIRVPRAKDWLRVGEGAPRSLVCRHALPSRRWRPSNAQRCGERPGRALPGVSRVPTSAALERDRYGVTPSTHSTSKARWKMVVPLQQPSCSATLITT